MTSNIGSQYLGTVPFETDRGQSPSAPGTLNEGVRRQVMDALRGHFRPEFLNRIDETIVFHPLTRTDLASIVDIQARHLLKRLEDRKIHVELTPASRSLLVDQGYDPAYGARPLKRTIQRLVLDPLAHKVLEGQFREGDRILIDADAGAIVFRKAAEPESV